VPRHPPLPLALRRPLSACLGRRRSRLQRRPLAHPPLRQPICLVHPPPPLRPPPAAAAAAWATTRPPPSRTEQAVSFCRPSRPCRSSKTNLLKNCAPKITRKATRAAPRSKATLWALAAPLVAVWRRPHPQPTCLELRRQRPLDNNQRRLVGFLVVVVPLPHPLGRPLRHNNPLANNPRPPLVFSAVVLPRPHRRRLEEACLAERSRRLRHRRPPLDKAACLAGAATLRHRLLLERRHLLLPDLVVSGSPPRRRVCLAIQLRHPPLDNRICLAAATRLRRLPCLAVQLQLRLLGVGHGGIFLDAARAGGLWLPPPRFACWLGSWRRRDPTNDPPSSQL